MKETVFERNLSEATAKLVTYGSNGISAQEINEQFFGGREEMPPRLSSYVPVKGKKNAIVLVGASCTGKSTYAKNFIKTHPDFEYLSLDDCALKELNRTHLIVCFDDNIMNNTLGNREFGERIEKGQNLIIDGGWAYINSRSALLKTLKHYGYNVCAFVFCSITNEEFIRNVEARVIGNLAYEMLKNKPEYCNKDWLAVYQEESKLSREKAIATIRGSSDYQKRLIEEINILMDEKRESSYLEQVESGLIVAGFDSFVVI